MKKLKEKSGLLVIGVLLIALLASACTPGQAQPGNTEPSNPSASAGSTKTYTVSIRTVGGMILAGTDVYIYSDNSLSDLVAFGQTDANGLASFPLPEKDGYAIAVSGVAKGYDVQSSYSFTGSTCIITLRSSLIDADITGAGLSNGDVMYDFTVTDTQGDAVTLSDILKTKKAVVFNFWYTGCSWCWLEFPVMNDVYPLYADDVEILALDPYAGDDVDAILNTLAAKDMQMGFPVAKVSSAWSETFGIVGYPTTVVIDRYGVICMVESGAITSRGAWINIFDYFTADDYEQKLIENASDLVVQTKPTYTMPTEEEIAQTLGSEQSAVHYYPSEGEYAWPFLIGEKNGVSCVYASNSGIDSSYAILCMDVQLKAGQALGLDYFASTEQGTDILHVIVNDEDVYRISGVSEGWQSVYPCVAEQDGTYSIVLSYVKDDSTDDAEDTVYLANLRVVQADRIDTATYLPREAATTADGFTFSYVDIVLNSADGYYHVRTADGPLLLANLTAGTSQFNETETAYMLAYDRGSLMLDGVDVFAGFEAYAGYASNATILGYCPVTPELASYLRALADAEGFDPDDANEWMKLCRYYDAYGTDGAQLEDPIRGLANFSAYTALEGKNVASNYFYYDRQIYPRGLRAAFTPERSGVYRITSRSNSVQGVDSGWIFDEDGNVLLDYEPDERMYDGEEVSMVFYMEAGRTYYLSIAFWDMYEEGYIYYDIVYLAKTLQFFRLASPAYFTYDGEELNYTVAGGIDVVLGEDGFWYEDLGVDENGRQRYGGMLYVDFTGSNGLFSNPIMSYDAADGHVTGMIDMGGFDFSKTEEDEYILSILRKQDGDAEAAIAYLREYWGEDYDENAQAYQLEDVLAGRYHGTGEDCTEQMRAYLTQVDTSPTHTERNGCVRATAELTELLQKLMDKYTFKNVEHSWTKLCYYYDYLGPEQ